MKYLTTILFVSIITLSFAQKNKGNTYEEDLSKVHPTYSYNLDSLLIQDSATGNQEIFVAKNSDTKRLDNVLDSLFERNKNIKYVRGYRVLVYSGSTQEDALEVRKAILELLEEKGNEFNGSKVDFIYHQPMFRIKVGEYRSRLEAVRMAEYLKSQPFDFGEESEITVNPLVVPDNIEIQRQKD